MKPVKLLVDTLMERTKLTRETRVELTRKILQVCASCDHAKWQGGTMVCDRKKSQCHSKRVRKWLKELKES